MYACLYEPPAPSHDDQRRARGDRGEDFVHNSANSAASALNVVSALVDVAADFSPRFERHRDGLVSIDIGGLERLFLRRSVLDTPERNGARTLASWGGAPRSVWKTIGEELRRDAAARGLRVHVAIAATRTASLVLACARPGLTVVEPGEQVSALAAIPVDVLEKVSACGLASETSESS